MNVIDDASSASAKLKGELPGSGKEAQKQGEEYAHKAGAAIDSTVSFCKLFYFDEQNADFPHSGWRCPCQT